MQSKIFIYCCDYCRKELKKRHISIAVDNYAGYVSPPDWKHPSDLGKIVIHFDSIKCLDKFLTKNLRFKK